MNKSKSNVVNIGKPEIDAISESEKDSVLSAVVSRIISLSNKQRTELSVLRG